MRAEARARLLDAIAKARLWLDGLITGRFTITAEIALYERCSERAVRITLSRLLFPNIAGKKRGAASTAPKLCKPAPMGGEWLTCSGKGGIRLAEYIVQPWINFNLHFLHATGSGVICQETPHLKGSPLSRGIPRQGRDNC